MSRCVKISTLSDSDRNRISKNLHITQIPPKMAPFAKPKTLILYDIEEDNLYLPFAYAKDIALPNRSSLGTLTAKFQGELRPPQKVVQKEAIKVLNNSNSVIIAAYPSFGKTCLAINIACKIGLKTLIVCHRIVLINQWVDSIKKFSTGKVQVVKSGDEMNPESDFYVMNAINIPKRNKNDFSSIGFLVCDELHILMAERLSQCMRCIVPRYVLGLSATPYRPDGLDILLDVYCGTHKIERKLYRNHTVYKVETGFKPEVKLNSQGKVDWSSVIDSTCNNNERNDFIIKIIQEFKDRVFLVLCKRVSQAKYLVSALENLGEDVTSLYGSNQKYHQESRILVGTSGKLSVGFDHPRLNTLLLASDVEQYFIQVLGRIFRKEASEGVRPRYLSEEKVDLNPEQPMIFDILDDHPILRKHFQTRTGVYLEHGGTLKNFRKDFPNLSIN